MATTLREWTRNAGNAGDAGNWPAIGQSIRKGLPFSQVTLLQKQLGLNLHEVAQYLQIADRTLLLRKKKGKLNATESDRLYRLMQLVQQTITLFDENADAVQNWWKQPCRGLGDRIPLHEARTEAGARAIEALIGQLLHGVFP
ncbi:MAG TPA: DUF2384 domain-containing protein [Gemmatales bacterium]|nr:DUF2384 domain-containing protein [Gemmatales bacterium]HMP16905.1 DUF2384 domain-containing protein [Gemmatales bacterium]